MKKPRLYEMVGRLSARVEEQDAEIVRLIGESRAEPEVPDEPPKGVCVGAISTRLCRVCTLNKTCPARDAWLYRESHAERFPAVDPSGTLDTPTPTE